MVSFNAISLKLISICIQNNPLEKGVCTFTLYRKSYSGDYNIRLLFFKGWVYFNVYPRTNTCFCAYFLFFRPWSYDQMTKVIRSYNLGHLIVQPRL